MTKVTPNNEYTSTGLAFSRVKNDTDDPLRDLLIEIDWDNITPKTIFEAGRTEEAKNSILVIRKSRKEAYSRGFEVGRDIGRKDNKKIRELEHEVKRLKKTLEKLLVDIKEVL